MASNELIILSDLHTGTKVIMANLTNINLMSLWVEGYNLKGSYPYQVKFSFILIGHINGQTFLFDLLTCPDLAHVLEPLLESPNIIKIIYNHSELRKVLWNELKINLTSFFDCQLALRSKVNQEYPTFSSIYRSLDLKNEFCDEISRNNPRFWLDRPLTQQMLNISKQNTFLLHQIYQNLSFGMTEMTHDLRILQPHSPGSSKVNKSMVEIQNNKPILIIQDPKSVIKEIDRIYPRSIGVKCIKGTIWGKEVNLIALGISGKTFVFNQYDVISDLRKILESDCLKKIVFGHNSKSFGDFELVDSYDLQIEVLRVVGLPMVQLKIQNKGTLNLIEVCKYFKPDLGQEFEDKLNSEDILESLSTEMSLYLYLFEKLRKIQIPKITEVKIPLPKGVQDPILEPKPTKSFEIAIKNSAPNLRQGFVEPETSSAKTQGSQQLHNPDLLNKSVPESIKTGNINSKFLPASGIITKYADFYSAGIVIRTFKVISLDCKSSKRISLIVIGVPSKVFIFDVNAKPEKSLPILKGILEDSGIKKIMYKAGDTIQQLRDQFDILPRNKIDVFICSDPNSEALKVLGSLKKIQNQFESEHPSFWKFRPVEGVSLSTLHHIASFLIQNHEILTQKPQKYHQDHQQPSNFNDNPIKDSTPTSSAGNQMGNDIGRELAHMREMIENMCNGDSKSNLLKSVDHITGLVKKEGQTRSSDTERKKAYAIESKGVQTIFTGTIYASEITH